MVEASAWPFSGRDGYAALPVGVAGVGQVDVPWRERDPPRDVRPKVACPLQQNVVPRSRHRKREPVDTAAVAHDDEVLTWAHVGLGRFEALGRAVDIDRGAAVGRLGRFLGRPDLILGERWGDTERKGKERAKPRSG